MKCDSRDSDLFVGYEDWISGAGASGASDRWNTGGSSGER